MEKQLRLLEFVTEMHGDQKRKYTGVPYTEHLLDVAATMFRSKIPFGVEIALCHDLLEDTRCRLSTLHDKLIEIGYDRYNASTISLAVNELTDIYTPDNTQSLNRKARKKLEAHRLWEITPLAQTVKYADLIDNTRSIVEFGKGFAKVYLDEKKYILNGMRAGDEELLKVCESQIEELL